MFIYTLQDVTGLISRNSSYRPTTEMVLTNDVTLVPKHVGVGTWYEVRFVIYFIVF